MKKSLLMFILLGLACFSYAQTREDILISVPMPTGGQTDEQQFFKEQFEMETTAAGYTITDNQGKSDYLIKLEIAANMVEYEDGTTDLPPPDEPQKKVTLRLVDNHDNHEIVMFEFPFDMKEEMYDWNLFLLYQAMANVPMTKLTSVVDTNHWRNKWLYLRASFDYPSLTFYAFKSDPGDSMSGAIYNNKTNPWTYAPLEHQIKPLFAGTIGLELQFLNWMSAEADIQLCFGDPMNNSFTPSVGFQVKFPLKPSKHFMLEPYGTATFPMLTDPKNVVSFPTVGVGGGFQFGVKGGEMGAFFLDVNYIWYIGDVTTKNTDTHFPLPEHLNWHRFVVGFALGYKIGFFNRNKDEVPVQ